MDTRRARETSDCSNSYPNRVMNIVALLALALPIASPSPQDDLVPLGTYEIGGASVVAKVPNLPDPFAEGQGLRVTTNGTVVPIPKLGSWARMRAAYEIARGSITPTTPEWKVKLFVLPRCTVLDRNELGMYQVRQGNLVTRELEEIKAAAALFASMVEATAGGNLRATIDWTIDTEWAHTRALPRTQPYGEAFLQDYLTPRFNGGAYEAEDRVYRGPYDSVFLVHSAPALGGGTTLVNRTPVTSLSFYNDGEGQGPYGLAASMYNAWAGHLRFAASRHGYRIPASAGPQTAYWHGEALAQSLPPLCDPTAGFPQAGFGSLTLRSEASGIDFAARRGALDRAEGYSYAEVAEDPFARLPWFDRASLGERIGANLSISQGREALQVEGVPRAERGIDGRLELGTESLVLLRSGDPTWIGVDPGAIQRFIPKLEADFAGRWIGWLAFEGGHLAVVRVREIPRGTREADLLGLETPLISPQAGDVALKLEFDLRQVQAIPSLGSGELSPVSDAQRGEVLNLELRGAVRGHRSYLAGSPGGATLFDAAKSRYLTFWVKAEKPEPLVIRLESADPSWGGLAFSLFGQFPDPEEATAPARGFEVATLDTEAWQQVMLDLASLPGAESSMPVRAVILESQLAARFWFPKQPGALPKVRIDDLIVSSQAPDGLSRAISAIPLASPDATSKFPLDRALWAAQLPEEPTPEQWETALKLFQDPSEVVRLNLCWTLTRLRSPDSIPLLARELAGLAPRVSEAAAAALTFQETPEAFAALKRAVEVGPFDWCREFAASAFRAHPDPKMLGSLSGLLTGRGWRARQAGPLAIGALDTQESKTVILVFLHEIDPSVRYAATRNIDPDHPLGGRRLLWSAVNDPSDAVRLASYLRLLESTREELVAEGLKGVRDDSIEVRRQMLEFLATKFDGRFRPGLQIAVVDRSPEIRAAALRAFAQQLGPVTVEEVENARRDADPRVRAAYLELARIKGLPPPIDPDGTHAP